jgi:alkylhydroperoxidase/carboxymuconolactone decarboxylase family protein YurZ
MPDNNHLKGVTAVATTSIEEYYGDDIGRLPSAIAYAVKYAPEAFDGYMASRRWVIDKETTHSLPKPYANLIFAILDVATGNVEGATNHSRAALKSGLKQDELIAAYVQAWLVAGFAGAWGKVCWRVLEQLEQEGLVEAPN